MANSPMNAAENRPTCRAKNRVTEECPRAGPGPPMANFSRLSPTNGRKVRKPVRVFVEA